MRKKCTICGDEAKFKIKDTSDYYCEECAMENFGDLEMLVRIEDIAVKLKKIVEEKVIAPQEEELNGLSGNQ